MIEIVRKCFQIDIGRIHLRKKLAARCSMDITGRDSHRFDIHGMAGARRIDGVFEKDHRIVIGEGYAGATVFGGGPGDLIWFGLGAQTVKFTRFGDIPVLAEFAGQITAGSAEGEYAGTGIKMVERFLFNRIDAETG